MAGLASAPPLAAIDDTEVAIARQIQAAFLPPKCKGCEGVSTAARRRTSGSVGGDFHDFIVTEDGRYSVIIGDVIGHGLHSALGMALVLGAIRALGPGVLSPLSVVRQINDLLRRVNDRLRKHLVMCSLFYGIVDPMRQMMRFYNAGHPYPLAWTYDGQVLELRSTGPLLGVLPELDGESITLPLEQVSRVVLYTDGVTEARSPSGEFLDVDRVQQVLEQTLALPVEEQADALMTEAALHAGPGRALNDDATVIVLDFGAHEAHEQEVARA
jgi:sigma-B regulation protein RsbU (phosphoserine phosphatase)